MIKGKTAQFFEVGIRFDKTQEDGTQKKVTEKYAIDALSFTEAEASALEEMKSYISGDYKITSEAMANYQEVVTTEAANADKYYKVRTAFIIIDEKTEKEKRSNVNFLVQASSLRNALDNFDTFMGTTMVDYIVVSVAETRIMDVFFHKVEPKDNADESGEKKATD